MVPYVVLMLSIACVLQQSNGLTCYSCSGDDCADRLARYPDRVGTCKVTQHDANGVPEGKCFIRRDPNDKLYWGCINDTFWPGVAWRNQNGCGNDVDHGWEPGHTGHRPLVWCFCQSNDCNLNVQRVNETTAASTTVSPTPAAPSCPTGWINRDDQSCYLIVTPGSSSAAQTQSEAEEQCKMADERAELVSLESDSEADFVASILRKQKSRMLNYWQGWWTSARCSLRSRQFRWRSGVVISTITYWSFMNSPFPSTCVWVMQNPAYGYGWGNYDCRTKAGYICEIELSN